jgi:succinate dehydrogenase / fumarate reductase flavoprotein subunit
VAEAVTLAAIERKESRGGHFRDDHPDKDGSFGSFNIVIRRDSSGGMKLERRPIPPLPAELQAIVDEQKS